MHSAHHPRPRPWYLSLWFLVLLFMLLGIGYGINSPKNAVHLRPIVDNFIHLIKIFVGPIVFCTVINGMLGMGSLKQLGAIGFKAFIYFEAASSCALIIGLGLGHLLHPGTGLNLSVASIDPSLVSQYTTAQSQAHNDLWHILAAAIPTNPWQPFSQGNTLQILFMAIGLGIILLYCNQRLQTLVSNYLHQLQHFLFKILSWIMWFSPIAAFAAMAFMLGEFGLAIIWHMLGLVASMIFACCCFILLILGSIAYFAGFNILHFLNFIKDEIILVFATSSSESALGPIMEKLTNAGVDEGVVGIVIPAGYSFNLDGTNLYLAMVIAFLCQAFNIQLSLAEHLTIILVLMATSKGAAGVSGSGFIVLAGTLAAMHGKIPVATIAILLGIDKIMSELRSTTNLVGNSIAAVVIARWVGKLNQHQFKTAMRPAALPPTTTPN